MTSWSAVWRSPATLDGSAWLATSSTLGTQLNTPTVHRWCWSRCTQNAKPARLWYGTGRAVMMTTRSVSGTTLSDSWYLVRHTQQRQARGKSSGQSARCARYRAHTARTTRTRSVCIHARVDDGAADSDVVLHLLDGQRRGQEVANPVDAQLHEVQLRVPGGDHVVRAAAVHPRLHAVAAGEHLAPHTDGVAHRRALHRVVARVAAAKVAALDHVPQDLDAQRPREARLVRLRQGQERRAGALRVLLRRQHAASGLDRVVALRDHLIRHRIDVSLHVRVIDAALLAVREVRGRGPSRSCQRGNHRECPQHTPRVARHGCRSAPQCTRARLTGGGTSRIRRSALRPAHTSHGRAAHTRPSKAFGTPHALRVWPCGALEPARWVVGVSALPQQPTAHSHLRAKLYADPRQLSAATGGTRLKHAGWAVRQDVNGVGGETVRVRRAGECVR